MDYLIAVMGDRLQAEAAYTDLETAGLPAPQRHILGRGYKTADEFGFIDPSLKAKNRAKQMALWLVPFGFFAGYCFDLITGLDTFGWAGEPGNHIVGGLAGAVSGAMGSVFVGGGVGLSVGSGDDLPYRNRLKQGKYLVIVNGDGGWQDRAEEILRQHNPESLQPYTPPQDIYR